MRIVRIGEGKSPLLEVVQDTIVKNKQALVFVNSRKSAEKAAEDVAVKLKVKDVRYDSLAEEVLGVLSRPTDQCERLAKCIRKGVAFHHAGLHPQQKELVENAFREGVIKIIGCTPTLCLSGDAKVWHGMTESRISEMDLSTSLFVLSSHKIMRMKAQKVENNGIGKILRISSISGYSIDVTPNHKFLVKRNHKKLLVEASEIKKTDKIATVGRLKLKNSVKCQLNDFVEDNVLPHNIQVNQILCYFIGAMLGDGYSGAQMRDGSIEYKGSPCIVGIDAEIFDKVKIACKLLHISYRESKNYGGTPQLILGKNNWFREFLCRSGVEKRDKKHIAKKLMYLDKKNISEILQGLFDTDGFVNNLRNVGFSNTSEKLVRQVKKLLLRFGIISWIRKKKAGSMKIHEKRYKTLPSFEVIISHKKGIIDFYKYVGFAVERKQESLLKLVAKMVSNVSYFSCKNCDYKLYASLFSGRTKQQKEHGKLRWAVIKSLGEKGEMSSKELFRLLGRLPRGKDARLNHHYFLINKRRVGSKHSTDWLWSLNRIGAWVFKNIIQKKRSIHELLKIQKCPMCGSQIDVVVKNGWKSADFEGDIYWDGVKDIQAVKSMKTVYDVVLPNLPKNDHLFVAEGFFVHNSAGMDLPAFRAIIRDVKRYGERGLSDIPVLEYLQMAGRAGRPRFDSFGESILIASSDGEKNRIWDKYVHGSPEDIYSKLAVEPVLRTYVLSLVAVRTISTFSEVFDFFGRTFWAHQYKDMKSLEKKISQVVATLVSWDFLAEDSTGLKATVLGERVAQLYIDPFTAHQLIQGLQKAASRVLKPLGWLHLVCNALEMRPLLRMKVAEFEVLQSVLTENQAYLLEGEPSMFESGYEDYLNALKTSLMLRDWVDEKDEQYLLERYDCRPGETKAKLETADWLLYSTHEIARLLGILDVLSDIAKLRVRLKYGVREELLPLIRLRDVGRVRARRLFSEGVRTLGDVRSVDAAKLSAILGPQVAAKVKAQVGQGVVDDELNVPRLRDRQRRLNE